jgi:hypothetical protein
LQFFLEDECHLCFVYPFLLFGDLVVLLFPFLLLLFEVFGFGEVGADLFS